DRVRDPQAAAVVERHVERLVDLGLACEELDREAGGKLERLLLIVGRERVGRPNVRGERILGERVRKKGWEREEDESRRHERSTPTIHRSNLSRNEIHARVSPRAPEWLDTTPNAPSRKARAGWPDEMPGSRARGSYERRSHASRSAAVESLLPIAITASERRLWIEPRSAGPQFAGPHPSSSS